MAEDSLPGSTIIMELPNEEFSENRSSTQNIFVRHRYTWTIDDFSFSFYKIGETSVSPTFSVGMNNNKSEWRLILCPNAQRFCLSNNIGKSCTVSCQLELIACKKNEMQAVYNIHILNTKREKIITFSSSGSKLFKKGECNLVLSEHRDISDSSEKNEFSFHDKLSIVCEIIYKVDGKNNLPETLPTLPSTPTMDFTFLFENKKLMSDVTLCANGREFPAHKVILSAGSPVFRAMFQYDMEETKNNRVEITDIDEEGLDEMLRYMYTGKIQQLEKLAPQLLNISEKYQLDDLKIRCEEALLKSLSLENVAKLFILSDMFRATKLNIHVKQFIKAHGSGLVIRPEFRSMIRKHPDLAELLIGGLEQ